MSAERWQQAVDEHEEIIKALEQKDGELLGSILKRHLENKFETVRQWLRQHVGEDSNKISES
jgi:DNA-binding GntR family transcriptional regulator